MMLCLFHYLERADTATLLIKTILGDNKDAVEIQNNNIQGIEIMRIKYDKKRNEL